MIKCHLIEQRGIGEREKEKESERERVWGKKGEWEESEREKKCSELPTPREGLLISPGWSEPL